MQNTYRCRAQERSTRGSSSTFIGASSWYFNNNIEIKRYNKFNFLIFAVFNDNSSRLRTRVAAALLRRWSVQTSSQNLHGSNPAAFPVESWRITSIIVDTMMNYFNYCLYSSNHTLDMNVWALLFYYWLSFLHCRLRLGGLVLEQLALVSLQLLVCLFSNTLNFEFLISNISLRLLECLNYSCFRCMPRIQFESACTWIR